MLYTWAGATQLLTLTAIQNLQDKCKVQGLIP